LVAGLLDGCWTVAGTVVRVRCCHPTRREILARGAVVAASPFLSGLVDPERAYALTRQAVASGYVAYNLELVTLTETSMIVTWVTGDPTLPDEVGRPAPVPADSSVLLGTSPATMREVFFDGTASPYHYAEITGLEPGQTYFFVARSGAVAATPSVSAYGSPIGTSALAQGPSGPFSFVTPQPPPGRFLFSIVLCNALHLGETVAGLATTQHGLEIPPGIRQREGEPPYAEVMARALAAEGRERGAHLLLAAGDISSEASSIDIVTAKSFLDGFGDLGSDYLVARGNHDRPHTGAGSAACASVPGSDGYHDCFADAFFPAGPTWFQNEIGGLRILGLDTYDTIGPGSGNGIMSAAQMDDVRTSLAADPDQPTLVFGHHPVSLESSATTIEPIIFDLDQAQARELEAMYAASPGVFLHHAAHTHRNKRTLAPGAPNVVFQEVSAVKEYPGGFHLLRVHSGGYALNFHKFRSPMAQEWAERSRPEYGGASPFYVFGNTADRNSVRALDLSGLTAPTGPPASVSELGGVGAATVGGIAIVGAALAARRRLTTAAGSTGSPS
jgi:hypothetical protein